MFKCVFLLFLYVYIYSVFCFILIFFLNLLIFPFFQTPGVAIQGPKGDPVSAAFFLPKETNKIKSQFLQCYISHSSCRGIQLSLMSALSAGLCHILILKQPFSFNKTLKNLSWKNREREGESLVQTVLHLLFFVIFLPSRKKKILHQQY